MLPEKSASLHHQTRLLSWLFLSCFFLCIQTGVQSEGVAQQVSEKPFARALAEAAIERTTHQVTYDGSYHQIPYPMGDVPDEIGVCTDVVIRAYRTLGIDLQELLHEDMQTHYSDYPSHWGLHKPDPNIDHRRVPNLQTFLTRHGTLLPITHTASDYKAGDLVTWIVNNHLPHIGIVTHKLAPETQRPMIVHNIGKGPKLEDMLFQFPITGHYGYEPQLATTASSPKH